MRRAPLALALLAVGCAAGWVAGCAIAVPFPDHLDLWLDCDGDGLDETPFGPADCGACGLSCDTEECTELGSCFCPYAGAVAGPVGGGPSCLAMGPSFRCCTEGCFDIDNDVEHCGECDSPCGRFFRTSEVRCVAGECALGACEPGYADCDGLVENGCEADLESVDHCGGCHNACLSDANSALACSRQDPADPTSGSCVVSACFSQHGDCNGEASDGCEADLITDAESCGSCGYGCAEGESCRDAFCPRGVVRIATGDQFTCALQASGRVLCWGWNVKGQLGNGDQRDRYSPTPVSGIEDAISITAGSGHACALREGGAVVCWGQNSEGQVGDGSTRSQLSPVEVSGLPAAVEIRAGGSSTCALTMDGGEAYCWGANDRGQLGDGSRVQRPLPTAVRGLSGATALTVGASHACALLPSGAARCWGNNDRGQLGDGSRIESTSPVAVSGLTGAIGLDAGTDHTCAWFAAGVPQCWGSNLHGALGDGSAEADRLTPTAVSFSGSVVGPLSAGHRSTCAVAGDRPGGITLECWGSNLNGELGDGSFENQPTPVTVLGGGWGEILEVRGEQGHFCVLDGNGAVWCWGQNGRGEVGDSAIGQRIRPTRVFGMESRP